MNLLGTSFIGFTRGSGTEACGSAINQATGEVIEPTMIAVTDTELERATELAQSAFTILKQKSGAEKAALLRKIADKIGKNVELIVQYGPIETGLPEGRMRGETGRTVGQLRLFASHVEKGNWVDARIELAQPDRTPLPKSDLRSMLRPLGPVLVFTASNFPLAFSVAGGDTASALAAGCPVIVKAHSSHPALSEIVANCISEAVKELGFPEGTFSLIQGSGRKVGQALAKHPKVKAIGFTGSYAGGRALMDTAAARPEPIPVYAEMSSINPVCILPSAVSKENLAQQIFDSLTLGVGQFCTNPGLIFIPKEGSESLKSELKSLAQDHAPATMLNSGICSAYNKGVKSLNDADGVTTLHIPEAATINQAQPAIFVTLADAFLNTGQQDEVFGPATLLVEYADQDQLLQLCAGMEGQLTASIFSEAGETYDVASILSVIEDKAGRVIFNEFPTGVEVCHSMVHGGPFPSTSDGKSTSVGTMAINRFARPVSYQGLADNLLPAELRDGNPLNLTRTVDGEIALH